MIRSLEHPSYEERLNLFSLEKAERGCYLRLQISQGRVSREWDQPLVSGAQ